MPESPLNPIPGTVELLVLRTLGIGTEMHGFEILEWIKDSTEGALVLEHGALYHALHRMERRRWVIGEWGVSEKGRKAKYYSITMTGTRVLVEEEERWGQYVRAVAKIAPCKGEG